MRYAHTTSGTTRFTPYLLEENHHLTPSWNLSLAQCILLPKLGEDYGGGGGHVLAETFPSMRLTEINGD